MKRIFEISIIIMIISSCSAQESNNEYDSKAIELNEKAIELMMRSEYDKAIDLLDKAIKIDTTFYIPHANKVQIFLSKNEFDRALVENEIIIKKKPDLAEGWTFAGILHEKLGDTVTAIKYYNESIKIFDERISNPNKKDQIVANKLNRAFSLILLGREKEGKDEMRKIKAEDPNYPSIDEFLKLNKEESIRKLLEN